MDWMPIFKLTYEVLAIQSARLTDKATASKISN